MDCDDTKQSGKADIFRHTAKAPRVRIARARTVPMGTESEPQARCSKLTCFIFGCNGKHGDDAASSAVQCSRGDKNSRDQLLQREFERMVTRRLN